MPKADIAAQGYDLSLNRYKEVVHDEVAHRPPGEILEQPRPTGGGDSAGHEGTGGDAEVSWTEVAMTLASIAESATRRRRRVSSTSAEDSARSNMTQLALNSDKRAVVRVNTTRPAFERKFGYSQETCVIWRGQRDRTGTFLKIAC